MKKNEATTIVNSIQNRIYTIRGTQVMLDRDLAELYQVSTSRLNEQVKRNLERFPKEFKFQLTRKEFENLRSQFATSKLHGGRRYLPYVFTEQGVAMLSSVLNSKVAVKISIQIMQAFVHMRKFLIENANIFNRLDSVEQKQLNYQLKSDKRFEKLFKALEDKSLKPKQGIFYDGQIFDAYVFVADLIKSAKKSIVLIDNFIDESVLQLFSKRKSKVKVTIHTKNLTPSLKLDLKKFNSQYENISIQVLKDSHDRFLIVDHKELYHIGASLKDLGKKWFAFSRMDGLVGEILGKIKPEL
ncbi:MAG: ORF6N domain-containing protein [Patescibacteria group bacterium]